MRNFPQISIYQKKNPRGRFGGDCHYWLIDGAEKYFIAMWHDALGGYHIVKFESDRFWFRRKAK
jgi:hypothetical protein